MDTVLLYFKDYLAKCAVIYDAETPNKSFIKLSTIYKKKGIENNKWMLALCQKDLIGVDPHSSELSYDQKLKIGLECKINPIYFFREVCRVPVTGSNPVPFLADQANLPVLWLFLSSINLFEVIARQIGKTVCMLAIYEYITYIGYYNSSSSMVTQTDKLRVENISRLKVMRDALPKWMLHKSIRDSDNKEELYYEALGNKLLTFVGSADRNAADGKVRGLTVPTLGWDEFPYIKNNEVMYKAATATMSTAIEQAREAGVPSANMIFTTAGDLTTRDGKFAYSLVLGAMSWQDILFDSIDMSSLKKTVNANSVNDMVYITKSYLQLGKTKEWLEERRRKNSLSEAELDKDFRCIWSTGNRETSVVDPTILKLLNEYQRDPEYIQQYDNTHICWFKSKADIDRIAPTISCVMGADGSEAIGADFTTFVITDSSDLSVLGTCKCNISNLLQLSEMIFELLMKFKRMIFVPERNSTGAAIVDNILIFFSRANVNPYKRIFNTFVDTGDNLAVSKINQLISPLGSDKKRFGFRTTGRSRDLLYNTVLHDSISECKTKLYDQRLIEEIQGLEKRNGRIDHSEAGHDDLLVAWLLCLWFIKYARNTHLYDIDSSKFMVNHIDPHAKYTKQEIEQQMQLRVRREGLVELIKISFSNSMGEVYKRELRLIESAINEDIKVPVKTASDVEESVRKKRDNRKRDLPATLRRFYPPAV